MSGISSFYLPEKLAMFVPIFAVLERNTFGTPDARNRNIKHYLKSMVVPYFENDCKKLQEILQDEQQVQIVKKFAYVALDFEQKEDSLHVGSDVLADIGLFYDAGHSFYDWNFANLTEMRHLTDVEIKSIKKFREHLITEIEDMNSFILPPED